MFIPDQTSENIHKYTTLLQAVGSLSRLFSESKTPYLYYRAAENIFCKSFVADNLSRGDTTADASLNGSGFGLKTFLRRSEVQYEKVAEFNRASSGFRKLKPEEQVREIIRLRNERITTTKTIYGIEQMLYHCVVRESGGMYVVETPMHPIDIDSVKIISADDKRFKFEDRNETYSFNISKSTLLKSFNTGSPLLEIPVSILDDPYVFLESLSTQKHELGLTFAPIDADLDYVVLPLYSVRKNYGEEGPQVQEKSGLNQWNASGRERNANEVYIPIPASIHKVFPNFFPARDISFNLRLPDKQYLTAKVCQDGGKALMSDPNKVLGQWILRDVLRLQEGELLTYKKLRDIGLDSVVIYKISNGNYRIDFAKLGSYEQFKIDNALVLDELA